MEGVVSQKGVMGSKREGEGSKKGGMGSKKGGRRQYEGLKLQRFTEDGSLITVSTTSLPPIPLTFLPSLSSSFSASGSHTPPPPPPLPWLRLLSWFLPLSTARLRSST